MIHKKYNHFDNWFHELEGFSTRSERCYDDVECTKNLHLLKTIRKWLEAAFLAGRTQTSYELPIKEDEHGLYLVLPPELLAQTGWQIGTVLDWHDNEDGSWTIKAR